MGRTVGVDARTLEDRTALDAHRGRPAPDAERRSAGCLSVGRDRLDDRLGPDAAAFVQPIHTFSIGFPVSQFDETSYAREAAVFLGTRHHEQIVEPHALSILPKLIWHYDEPFSDSSAIPTMYLSEMTRREVTVALSGDGGDEMFCGYDRYRAVGIAHRLDDLPRWVKGFLSRPVWQRIPGSIEQKSYRRRIKRLLAELGKTPERRYLRWINIFDDGRRQRPLLRRFRRARWEGPTRREFLLEAYAECPDRDFVSRTTCADILTYLPCDILTKVDIASMAYSLSAAARFWTTRWPSWPPHADRAEAESQRRQADSDRDLSGFVAAVDPDAVQDGLWRSAGPLVPRRTAAPAVRNAARLVKPRPRPVQTGKHSPADRRARISDAGTTAIGCGR